MADISTYRYEALQTEYLGSYLWTANSAKQFTEPVTHGQKQYPYSLGAQFLWDNPASFLEAIDGAQVPVWHVDLAGGTATITEGNVLTIVDGGAGTLVAEFVPPDEVEIPGDLSTLEIVQATGTLYYQDINGDYATDETEVTVQIATNMNIDTVAPFAGVNTVHLAVNGITLTGGSLPAAAKRFRLLLDQDYFPISYATVDSNTVITAADDPSIAVAVDRTTGDAALIRTLDLDPPFDEYPFIQLSMAAPLESLASTTLNILPFHLYLSNIPA